MSISSERAAGVRRAAESAADDVPAMHLSVIVPLYNEEDSVGPLAERLSEALKTIDSPWEVVLVDDGSQDATVERAIAAAPLFAGRMRLIRLRRNFGQTAAMQAGIDAAYGEFIVTMDGDL